jgi:transmembrane sensor
VTDALDKDLDEILEAAAAWHVRLDLGTADQVAFVAWRDADPRHAAAFARMEGTDGAVKRGKDRIPGEVDEFEINTPQVNRRQWLSGALGAVAAGVIGLGGFAAFVTHRARAETPVGGKAEKALPDGGSLTINTDSRASWRFDRRVREIWLERGEIALSMPVEGRTWRIHADGHIISGQGGKLNIRLRGKGVEVTLLDGPAVVVAGDEVRAYGVMSVAAGQSVMAVDGGAPVKTLSADDIHRVIAWQSDEMLFTGQTLTTVVDEYNRYLTRKIVILDPALASLRLGGRFNVHDTTAFLAALKTSFGINARVSDTAIELSR